MWQGETSTSKRKYTAQAANIAGGHMLNNLKTLEAVTAIATQREAQPGILKFS